MKIEEKIEQYLNEAKSNIKFVKGNPKDIKKRSDVKSFYKAIKNREVIASIFKTPIGWIIQAGNVEENYKIDNNLGNENTIKEAKNIVIEWDKRGQPDPSKMDLPFSVQLKQAGVNF